MVVVSTSRTCAAENGACEASHAKAASVTASAPACEHSSASTASAMAASSTQKSGSDHSSASARGAAAGPRRCSQPYGTACDLGASSTATAAARAISVDDAAIAHHAHVVAQPVQKPAARPPQPSGEPPAFGPLFLAHQALML
jgi:hypothetical protein